MSGRWLRKTKNDVYHPLSASSEDVEISPDFEERKPESSLWVFGSSYTSG